MQKVPGIPGIAVMIANDRGQFLFMKRKGKHGHGSWAFPGGKLEFMESFEDCAVREVREEVGVEISSPKFFTVTNDVFPEDNLHFLTIFMVAELVSGVAQNLEPDKCSEIVWADFRDLEGPFFTPIVNLLKRYEGKR